MISRFSPSSLFEGSPHQRVAVGLPDGLSIVSPSGSLESVATKAGTLDLLASGRGVEIIKGSLQDGERMTMVPGEPGADALEACLLLEGCLLTPDSLGSQVLAPGSLISADGLKEPVSFTAVGDARFLYIVDSEERLLKLLSAL